MIFRKPDLISRLIFLLFVSSLAFGCSPTSRAPKTAKVEVTTRDYLSKGFFLGIGTWESQQLIKGGETIEVDVDPSWREGVSIPLYLETVYAPDIDPILDSMVGKWSIGELLITGADWNSPLKLVIGEATVWSKQSSWAQVSTAPTSEKSDALTAIIKSNTSQETLFRTFQQDFDDIQSLQRSNRAPGLCSASYQSVNSTGKFRVWATQCWAEYETVHLKKWIKIRDFAGASSTPELESASKEVTKSLERLADDFRLNNFVIDQSDLDQIVIQYRVSSETLFSALTSYRSQLNARVGNLQEIVQRLTAELREQSASTP
jgi:hypothetical protein